MNRYDILTRDINYLVLKHGNDQNELHRVLPMLIMCFCKNNNEACLTEIKKGKIHYKFITQSRIETKLIIDLNLLMRKYKILKINERRTTEGFIQG
jgi:hypothetical protein